jgi:hypothetical protein
MNRETAKQLFTVAFEAAEKHQRNLKKAQFASATRNIELEIRAWEIVEHLEAAARKAMETAIAAAMQLGGAEVIPALIAEANGAR